MSVLEDIFARKNAGEVHGGGTEAAAEANGTTGGTGANGTEQDDHTGSEAGGVATRKNAGEVHGGGTEAAADGLAEKPHYSLADLIEKTHPYNDENIKKEEEKLKKKRKRDAVFAAIGDGLNAFHQAYAYSRGIKPLTVNKSQSKAVRDKYDALDREREAHKAEYLNAYIRGVQADEERVNKEREYKLKERQQTRLEEDVKIRAAKAEAYANYQSSVVAKNEAQAAYWQSKANALEAGLPLEEAIKKAEEARKLAQTRASDAAAAKYGAEQQYKERQTEQLGQPTTTTVQRQTIDERGRTHTTNETKTVTKGSGSGKKPASGGGGKKPLPGQTRKKQLP